MTYKLCANTSSEPGGERCRSLPVVGHIYCLACRVAQGGYNRYNPNPKSVSSRSIIE